MADKVGKKNSKMSKVTKPSSVKGKKLNEKQLKNTSSMKSVSGGKAQTGLIGTGWPYCD